MMKIKTITLIIVFLAILSTLFYFLAYPAFVVIEKNDSFPENFNEKTPEINQGMLEIKKILEGKMISNAHDVKGRALILEQDNKKVLRFEDFETINGPDLHIYLSADKTEKDYIDLGQIKATKGNVNYELPEPTDLRKYNHVLVWCVPCKVLFSYSILE